MKIYVKVNENNKPWILDAITEAKDGYTPVLGLMDHQVLALLNYPDKCFMDNSGVIHAPEDLPISEQEKNANEVKLLKNKVNALQITIDNLQDNLEIANKGDFNKDNKTFTEGQNTNQ